MRKGPLLTLQHFVLRAEARKLYRECLRSLKSVDPATAAGVRAAARERFADNSEVLDLERARLARISTAATRAEPPVPLAAQIFELCSRTADTRSTK